MATRKKKAVKIPAAKKAAKSARKGSRARAKAASAKRPRTVAKKRKQTNKASSRKGAASKQANAKQANAEQAEAKQGKAKQGKTKQVESARTERRQAEARPDKPASRPPQTAGGSPPGERVKADQATPACVASNHAATGKSSFYISTAIAYPNGAPHIGHAYEAIATDALARFQRLDGRDVFFLTGTDEHGLKMVQTAEAERLPPMAVATRNAQRFKEMDQRLNVSFDRFIRTTEEQHHRSSQEIWRRMAANGDIYLDTYAGWYSVRDEAYYAEEETAVGADGVRRGPQGTPVEWVEEQSYFFKLSAYRDRLLQLYTEQRPDFIGPDSRRNEVISFVKSGLRDLSISRTTFDWGVKVPGDPKHVMYVWVDALTNYITGVGFPDEKDASWRYWPADVHIIGKDIIRFHAVYWPAFLMSAGIPVPRRVFAHGFLFNRGEKMSKSVGNVVDPFNLADQYGVDQLRYFLLREVPFGQDGSYNHEAIVARINADLANDLGNLAQRSLSMIARQYQGVLPPPATFSDNDKAILAQADNMIALARPAMATQQIHQALNAVWAVVAEANRYFAGEAPWALAKTDPERQGTVLYVTAEVVRQVAILAQPAMPEAAARLLDILGVPNDPESRNFAALGVRIKPGTVLPAPAPVFPRYIEPTAA